MVILSFGLGKTQLSGSSLKSDVSSKNDSNAPNTSTSKNKIRMHLYAQENNPGYPYKGTITAGNIELLVTYADKLLIQASQINQTTAAKNNSHSASKLLQVSQLENQAYTIKIKVAEFNFYQNQQEFESNQLQINCLIHSLNEEDNLVIVSYELILESKNDMKLAKELREEAYAQPNLIKILSAMSNAEDKQLLALYKQKRALETLNRASGKSVNIIIGSVN